MSTDAVEGLEQVLRAKSSQLTVPRPDECLACFIERMVRAFGCDNRLRWAEHYRDERAPQASGLLERLQEMGGYCDCEVLMNGYALVVDNGDAPTGPCAGAARSSTKPCELWRRAIW